MSESLNIEKKDDGASITKRWKEGNMSYSICVEKVEGGYIVTENKYGTEDTGNEKGKYIDESTKRVSTTNPLEEINKEKSLFGFAKEIFIDE